MEWWRVSNYDELAGLGGLYGAGRWHSCGRPIIYCSENPAHADSRHLRIVERYQAAFDPRLFRF